MALSFLGALCALCGKNDSSVVAIVREVHISKHVFGVMMRRVLSSVQESLGSLSPCSRWALWL